MTFLPERHGAFPNKDGTTHFALWAPDARCVAIKLGNDETIYTLYTQNDGWFKTSLDCGAGTAYRFIINSEVEVPDPASRRQLTDVHGWSCVVDQSYPWKTVTWHGRPWHEAVIYELHVGLMGGFKQVEAALPALAELGITAIELMPIHEFPGSRNWGYDGVLLFAPEVSYGTPDELKSLVDTAHALDLMVFVDVVFSHFGPEGNYLGQYAKNFFRKDIATPWGTAIDFKQPQVRDFFVENALMWLLDYRVDGLRFDAAHAIKDNTFLIDLAERIRSTVPASRHVHLMLENEDNNASLLCSGFNAQWNDDGHNVLHNLLTNEHEGYYADFSALPTAKLACCLKDGFIYQGEYTQRGHSRGEPSGHLPTTAFILFLQNHDQVGNRAFGERLIQLADPAALKVAVALVLLAPMIPLLFMGEELGSRQPFLYFTDYHDELAQAICKGRRTEFANFSHFSDPKLCDQIPDPNALSSFEQSVIDAARHSAIEHQEWRSFYQQLLNLRKTELFPRLVGTVSTDVNILAERVLCASWRMGDGCLLRIYLNFSNLPMSATPPWHAARLIFSHHILKNEYQQGILPANSILVSMEEAANVTIEASTLGTVSEPTFVLVEESA